MKLLIIAVLLWSMAAPAWEKQASGVEKITIVRTEPKPQIINALRIPRNDPAFRLEVVMGAQRVLGMQTLPEMLHPGRLPFKGKPVAAVNGDFFIIRDDSNYRGVVRGPQVSQGEIISCPEGTTAYPWTGRSVSLLGSGPGDVRFAEVQPALSATFPGGRQISFGVNGLPAPGRAMLYTPRMGLAPGGKADSVHFMTTRTDMHEIRFEYHAPVKFGVSCTMTVKAVNPHGNSRIVPDEYILAVPPEMAGAAKAGDKVEFVFDSTPSLKGVYSAVSGHALIVGNGTAQDTGGRKSKAPRTAIGFNDQYLILAVVDGRMPRKSAGVDFDELAAIMVELGAKEAVDFDGGGSSMLWLEGKIINSLYTLPNIRHISNALAVVRAE